MIPGDIDLTEKLDFRKTVRRETPQLPSTWKGDNKINKINFDSSGLTTTLDSNYSFSISSTNNTITHTYRVNYDDWFTTTSWTNLTPINSDADLYNNILESEINNTLNFSLTLDGEGIIYSKEDKFYEPKKDIFGNKITQEYIPKIPWKEESVERIPSIAWNVEKKMLYRGNYISYEDNWRLPHDWVFEDDEFEDIEFDTSNPYKKAKHLISWLFEKSLSFIGDYLDDKDPNLSYLTNMSWIRVRDAIID